MQVRSFKLHEEGRVPHRLETVTVPAEIVLQALQAEEATSGVSAVATDEKLRDVNAPHPPSFGRLMQRILRMSI